MTTKDNLALALEEAGLSWMARKAREGYYDDFESPLATPIIQLVLDLRARGKRYEALAERAMGGEFDGSLEESTVWFEREGNRRRG